MESALGKDFNRLRLVTELCNSMYCVKMLQPTSEPWWNYWAPSISLRFQARVSLITMSAYHCYPMDSIHRLHVKNMQITFLSECNFTGIIVWSSFYYKKERKNQLHYLKILIYLSEFCPQYITAFTFLEEFSSKVSKSWLLQNLSALPKFGQIYMNAHSSSRPTPCPIFKSMNDGKKKKKKSHIFPYCLSAPLRSSMSPPGVEAQSPPIAAGHRSLCPWRRQPTYCQLALKWRTFHHPTENTIKNTHVAVGGPWEPLPPVASLVTVSWPHPLGYLLSLWLSVCQLGWKVLCGVLVQTRPRKKERKWTKFSMLPCLRDICCLWWTCNFNG